VPAMYVFLAAEHRKQRDSEQDIGLLQPSPPPLSH
jgi:hypothetical protein